jgi:hypothetical protein
MPPPEQRTPATGRLTVGEATAVASQTIGPSGGTIDASGLKLEFPEGALAADTPVSVTRAPVTAANFGGRFTPLTALYTIDTGGAALAAPVTVTLPATVPAGVTALAFYFDESAGTLTPLAPIDAGATSITAAANHFSSIVGGVYNGDAAPEPVDSGFRPGVDDWQFANHGSYVAPGGHCEGQSDTAIWYYTVQRKKGGASPLHGLYDNNGAPDRTPTFQWDDAQGYRLASNVQADPTADPVRYWSTVNGLFGRPDDRMTYSAFRAAIDFTGEPQEIVISRGAGAHAMIVYRVTADRLFIADPNYPAKLRTIRYDQATGRLSPYASGANAADIAANGARIYSSFAYVPWRSAATEAALAAHWTEFEKNAAGNGVFPPYALEARETDAAGVETWVPLVNGYGSPERQITIRVRDPANINDVALKVFPGTSSTPLGDFAARQTIDLGDGDTALGIQVDFSKPTDTQWRYVDFVRLTLRRGPVASPAAGSWVLDGGPVKFAEGTSDCYVGSVTRTDGTVSIAADGDTLQGCGGMHVTATGSWSPANLPPLIVPDQPLPVTLRAEVAKAGNGGAEITVGVVVRENDQLLNDRSVHACLPERDGCASSATETLDVGAPAGSPGDTITYDLYANTEAGAGTYRYTYRWQGP